MFQLKVQRRMRFNRAGFRALLLSPTVNDMVGRRARAIAARTGSGWEARPAQSVNRSRWVVVPTTREAARESITEMTPVRALEAGK